MRLARSIMSAAVAATSLVAMAGVNAPAQAAQCGADADAGSKRALSSGYTARWVVKHFERRENFSGSKRRLGLARWSSSPVTNEVVGFADDSVEAELGWAKLQGRVGDRLDGVGTELTFAGFTKRTLSSGQILIHAAGARQHTMSLTLQVCQYQHPVGYVFQTYDSTTAEGWSHKVVTWIACDEATAQGSFKRRITNGGC